MNEENVYYITVPILKKNTSSTFFLNQSIFGKTNSISINLNGDMFFDAELVKNNNIKTNYRNGYFVGEVKFYLTESNDKTNAQIKIYESYLIQEETIQFVEMNIACTKDLLDELIKASENESELTIKFSKDDWEDWGDGFASYCRVEKIEITTGAIDLQWYEKHRIRHVENYLLTTLCGGRADGQIPAICSEISKGFANPILFNNRKDVIASIVELIRSIKWTLELEKSKLRADIEDGEDLDLAELFDLRGAQFDRQIVKISDEKKKHALLTEYNSFWKRTEAVEILKNGFKWCNNEFTNLTDEYLKIKSINSSYLNEILLDGLIGNDIAEMASHFQYSGKMSPAAILSVQDGVYNKSEIEVKGKSLIAVLAISLSKSVGWFIGNLISGFLIWWLTSFVASENETVHYILFGAIFGAWLIITALNQSKTDEALKEKREEFNFYILRDMCALHKQAQYMDTKLLRHLMNKLEERNVQFNPLIYKILNHVDEFKSY